MANTTSKEDIHDSSSYLIKRLLSEYIYPYKKRIGLAIICMIIAAGATASFAWIMQSIIDDIFVNKDRSMLVMVSFGVLFIFLIKGLSSYGQSYLMQCLGQRIITDMQLNLYTHLLNSDLSLMTKESSGATISRFANDIGILRSSIVIITTGLAKELITLVLLVSLMFYQSVTLSLIALIVFPVAVYPIMRLGKRMRKISHNVQVQLGHFTARLDETFKSIRIIKAYQRENFELKRASDNIETIYGLFKKASRNQSVSSPVMEIIGGVAIATVIWYGGLQVISEVTTAGKFISFLTALTSAYKPAKTLSGMNTNLQDGLAAARRLFALLDIQPSIKDKANAIGLKLEGKGCKISLKNVVFSYDDEKAALNGLSLDIPAGKTVALVGPSGGGKSTIMNLILRFYDPSEGTIEINEKDIKDIKLSSLRDHISFVSQDISLFDDSLAKNISYGKPNASFDEIRAAAKAAAADEFINELPQAYDSIIGENGFSLSGGQRQRISIARAILKNSPILLLDEATSALDPISEKKIQKALNKLIEGRTTIVIAHRLSTVENADIIYVLKHGKIVEQGTHLGLVQKGGEYNRLYKGLEYTESE